MDSRCRTAVRVRIGVALCALAGALFLVGAAHAQTALLDRFAGRDLWQQKPSRADLAKLERLVGNFHILDLREPQPWHIWKLAGPGRARYLVLLGKNPFPLIFPGGLSWAEVQLFDAQARTIGNWSFDTHFVLQDAEFRHFPEFGAELLLIRDVASEYFAVRDDRLRFVRLEGSAGRAVSNDYMYPSKIGFPPGAATADQWLALLESSDLVDVLSALTFLGGYHIDEPTRRFGPGPHRSQYADLFEHLLGDAGIRRAIDSLCHSENPWVADAAALAALGPSARHVYAPNFRVVPAPEPRY